MTNTQKTWFDFIFCFENVIYLVYLQMFCPLIQNWTLSFEKMSLPFNIDIPFIAQSLAQSFQLTVRERDDAGYEAVQLFMIFKECNDGINFIILYNEINRYIG